MKYLIALALAGAAWSQQLDLSKLDALASKAREAANVDLDADKLKMVSGLVPSDQPASTVMSQMKGVFVRAFEFDAAGAYSQADLDSVRAQLKGPNWSRIVNVKDKDELVEVWFYMDAGKVGGLTVIAAEPKELAVVNLVGPVDFQSLAKLGGTLGMPDMLKQLGNSKKPPPDQTKTK